MRSGVAQALQQAGQQLQGTLEDKAILVASISLTVLEVLETLVLYLELEWVDEQRRIVQYIHSRDVDGRHAVLSGPGSLNTSDGPVFRRCQMLNLLRSAWPSCPPSCPH